MAELPVFLSLDEAIQRFHLNQHDLERLIEAGEVRTIIIDGRVAVAEEDVWKASVHAGNSGGLVFISQAEAARRFHLDPEKLRALVESGDVRAVRVGKEIALAEEDLKVALGIRRQELWARVRHLDGVPIGLEEACARYKFSPSSVYRWIKRGYVRVIRDQRKGGRGRKRLLNEADVAYAALVAQERGRREGKRILTPEFAPPHCVPEPAR